MKKIVILVVVSLFLMGMQAFVQGAVVSQWDCNSLPLSLILTDSVGTASGTLEDKNSSYLGEIPPATGIPFIVSGAGLYGDYGNALKFTNLNDHVNLGEVDAFDFGQNDFTITGWFRTNNSARHARLIQHGTPGTGGFSILIFKSQGKAVFEVYGSDGVTKFLMGDDVVADDKWHWFAAVADSQAIYFYIDGMLQTNSGITYDPNTSASITGVPTYINRDAAAAIDHLTIYNTALSGDLDANQQLIAGELHLERFGMLSEGPTTCDDVKLIGYQNLADLNGDCKVNLQDFAMMASAWLYCSDPTDANCSRPWEN